MSVVLLGQSTTGANAANSNNNGTPFSEQYTALATGTIDTVWVFAGGTFNTAPRAAIYADSAGAPGARLAATAIGANTGTNVWYSLPLTLAVTSGTKYWIAWMVANPNSFNYTDFATTGGHSADGAVGQSSLPDPYGTPSGTFTNIINCYASGTTAAASAVFPVFLPRRLGPKAVGPVFFSPPNPALTFGIPAQPGVPAGPVYLPRRLGPGAVGPTFFAPFPQAQPLAQTVTPLIWLPPTTYPATRNRSFFIVRRRRAMTIPVQEIPVVEQRVPATRRSAPAARGRRIMTNPAQEIPIIAQRVAPVRRAAPRPARGRLAFPVQPQIAVPPMIPPKLGAPRRLLNTTARGHQWSAAYMVATVAPVLNWPPPRLGAPRRLLGTVTRGRPASPPWPQAAPTTKVGAPRRPQAPPGRGRRSGPPLPQRNPPYPWPPRTSSARSKASMVRRGRCVNVVPAQVTVPPIVITRTATRWRWLTVRRGRPGNPVLTQTQIVAPNPPCITDPTTVAVVVYLSHAVITPYTSAVKGINPYTSTGQIVAYTSTGHIVAYTAAPDITSPTSDLTVVSYTSAPVIGPRFCA